MRTWNLVADFKRKRTKLRRKNETKEEEKSQTHKSNNLT